MNTFLKVLLFLTLSLSLTAQEDIQLKLSNLHPRVGEEVTIRLSKNFSFSSSSKKYGNRISIPNIAFEEAREYTIGPFEFTFDGKKYSTNTITVTVEPVLPIKEGIYVRWYEEEEEVIVIVDHIFPLKKKTDTGLNRTSSTYSSNRSHAKIKEVPQAGVSFYQYSSHSRIAYKDKEGVDNIQYSYTTLQYRVQLDSKIIKEFKLLPKHFENFPKGMPYTPIVIPYLKKS